MKAAKFLICAEGGKENSFYRNPNGAAAGGFGAAVAPTGYFG